jgi:hypothetical protein
MDGKRNGVLAVLPSRDFRERQLKARMAWR